MLSASMAAQQQFVIDDKTSLYTESTSRKTFLSEIDSYSRFVPYAAMAGLKLAGVESRSSWDRMAVSTIFSNIAMAAAVYAAKGTVKEMRPDHSARNSFPSGHTAMAFTAATIFHKEYGLTHSPWYSAGAYAVAAGTGVMRVLNNHHWANDVIAGAGIGILSAELGYFVGDLLYRDKGICRREMQGCGDPDDPSFFDVQMGISTHSSRINVEHDGTSPGDSYIRLGTSTSAGIETAYFLNKHVGIGGMARVTVTPVKDFNDSRFIDTSLDLGIYGNLPLCQSVSLGTKALVGARLCSDMENDILKVTRSNAINFVTGISGTWHHKENCAWKVFADIDSSKLMDFVTVGAAFSVCF